MPIRAYLFAYKFFENIMAYVRSFKFMIALNKAKVFVNRNPRDVLQVIGTFLLSESPTYKNSIVMGRDLTSSTALLLVLIDLYLEGHSETHLNQFLEVLKNEFIKREQD